ncbi:PhzF family phenazine biosynthesis protein [Moraxella catarrhalis]|uniref:PhzF family phenazine biosynthesis protein n=1 Tax=Moraxella catarrhalis TaxID=480 RepID=UPI0007F5235F|nr:PhzF family phenazine biosynthesis protein [Moraxella catarrhalis]OAV28527.1 putative isomerase yddE, PhzC-PhzF family [Moraxella catarrhalis]
MTQSIRQFTIDAFTNEVFKGNPASVCLLDKWLDDDVLLNIAKENNLSETAFVVSKNDEFELRWFTPKVEVSLCGHATLATAFALYTALENCPEVLKFHTMSGLLIVQKIGDKLFMDLPIFELKKVDNVAKIGEILGVMPKEVYLGRDLLCVFDDENIVKNYEVNDEKIAQLDGVLCHFTAKGAEFDCVSRSFGAKIGISEDPVCGSAHCHIFPYWSDKIGKDELIGFQASERTGILYGRMTGDRLLLGGQAVLFAKSEIYV